MGSGGDNDSDGWRWEALGSLVIYIIITVIILAIIQWVFTSGVEILAEKLGYKGILTIKDYAVYVYIIVLFVLGWMIVNAVASIFYAMMTPKYEPQPELQSEA